MKTIFRTKLTKNFTTLPNEMLRDATLSFKARGILSMILSNSPEWVVTKGWIESRGTEGREAIKSGVDELMSAGYASFEQLKDENGKWCGNCWNFYDFPNKQPECGNPETRLPECGNPAAGNPPPSEGLTKEENKLPTPKASKERKAHPNRRELTDAFCLAYRSQFGEGYNFHGAADSEAADRLLNLGLSVDQIIDRVKKAWTHQGGWNCSKAVTLRFCSSRWEEIRAELKSLNGNVAVPARPPRNAYDSEIEPGEQY